MLRSPGDGSGNRMLRRRRVALDETASQVQAARHALHVGERWPDRFTQFFEAHIGGDEAIAAIEPDGGAHENAVDIDRVGLQHGGYSETAIRCWGSRVVRSYRRWSCRRWSCWRWSCWRWSCWRWSCRCSRTACGRVVARPNRQGG